MTLLFSIVGTVVFIANIGTQGIKNASRRCRLLRRRWLLLDSGPVSLEHIVYRVLGLRNSGKKRKKQGGKEY